MVLDALDAARCSVGVTQLPLQAAQLRLHPVRYCGVCLEEGVNLVNP